jgi:hypothetical protein
MKPAYDQTVALAACRSAIKRFAEVCRYEPLIIAAFLGGSFAAALTIFERGTRTKQIATALFISVHTVETEINARGQLAGRIATLPARVVTPGEFAAVETGDSVL